MWRWRGPVFERGKNREDIKGDRLALTHEIAVLIHLAVEQLKIVILRAFAVIVTILASGSILELGINSLGFRLGCRCRLRAGCKTCGSGRKCCQY